MPKASFRQSDVERLLRAAKRVGYPSAAVEKRPDGSLVLLTGPAPAPAPSALEQWRARRDAKHQAQGS